MLGVLLARAGVRVAVLEKHGDFLRDFRGDTIHPSTMEVIHELGWLDEFLNLPHQPVPRLVAQFGTERLVLADLSHLPTKTRYIAMMPQWDFLNFLAKKGAEYPSFELRMRTEATGLLTSDGRVTGVMARTERGSEAIEANLVVAADGRTSTMRAAAGFKGIELGAPMDVLWFGMSRTPQDTAETQARFDAGRIFIMLNRGDYWQCAFVIPKGSDEKMRNAGLDAFRRELGELVPFEAERTKEITSWDQVKLLTVKVDRLKEWARPGLLCIGDAAHAMSPVGGVGINLAIQDAVAAANILAEPLRQGRATFQDLQKVQIRRQWPTIATQRLQLAVQNNVIASALAEQDTVRPPLLLRAMMRLPVLSRIPARLIGLGVRREHVGRQIRDAAFSS